MQDDNELKTPPKTASIKPLGDKVNFAIAIPGGKSIANRAILLAGMAAGSSLVAGIPDGDDSRAALSALEQLGVRCDPAGEGTYRIHGSGRAFARTGGDIDIQSAGTVGRFLPGLLASAPAGDWRLVSSDQLARRPVRPLVDCLRAWGADIAFEREGLSFPLRVRGGGLAGGAVEISAAASTQFASGLLLAAPLTRDGGTVRIVDRDEEDRYIDTTIGIMRHFGAEVESVVSGAALTLVVKPGAYRASDLHVEADLNAALNFLILPLLVGGRATVTNVSGDTEQTGHQLLRVFSRLGGGVDAGSAGGVSVTGDGRPGGGIELNMRPMAEMALALGVLALFANESITMTNLGHIRNHETDRLSAMGELLEQVGARVEVGPDWVRVHPLSRDRIKNVTIDSRGDHRVVMAFSLLGLAANGITITNADAVSKTFPTFFRQLRSIGADVMPG